MKIQDKIRIEHIQEAISEIESYVKEIGESEFIQNSLIRSATVRQFEVIGEAIRFISEALQNQYPKIPWRLWADFRNILIHQYFGVDYAEVYKTVQSDLPNLKLQINEILGKASDACV